MVQGLAQFNARWSAIPKKVRQAARETLEQNADEIVTAMRRSAPVGETGNLLISIDWTWGDPPKGSMMIGTVGGSAKSQLRITIFAGGKMPGGGDAFYARFQEFGTKNMTANPFFFPVWRAKRKRVRSRLTRNINKAIRQS
ncbi:HK97 gp10 family phage protein [Palleronia aestuarii]|uniref:HK97 gp10 family phage protein n=1 Tax=Palleronia aestuarii TaxID=568105 RepID=A0A2W7NNV0_9RHOB|nr:HK97-gp10 family putative phage morphogenesis protein [Palleronia aestuarii]PZX19817.1 HK97 gp10 family phage protein [Palleronia aestuarii]